MKTNTHHTTPGNHPLHNPLSEQATVMPTRAGRLMRMHEVIKATGLGRSTIYELMKINDFPKQVKLGCRWVAWRSEDIEDWMANLKH